jgi:hypothetical protein
MRRRGRGWCLDHLPVLVLVLLLPSTAWCIPHLVVSYADHNSSGKPRLRKIRLTQKTRVRKIRLTWKARLWKFRLTGKTRLCRTRGARNWKKEKVLFQAKGQLHSGAQGVLPRHKNAYCKRCVTECWPRKKKRKSGILGCRVRSSRQKSDREEIG